MLAAEGAVHNLEFSDAFACEKTPGPTADIAKKATLAKKLTSAALKFVRLIELNPLPPNRSNDLTIACEGLKIPSTPKLWLRLSHKQKLTLENVNKLGSPEQIRTAVTALRGPRARPLHYGAK